MFTGYNPYQPQYRQPYQQPIPQQQAYTLPMIHADIIQIDSIEQGENFGVGIGQTQMMITKDESVICIKTALNNGQYDFTVYRKEEKKSTPQPDYVTRSEVEEMLKGLKVNEPIPKLTESAEQ